MIRLDFWFDFASTYSYPAAIRAEKAAQAKGVVLRWRPFLLGPIFAGQGWTNSPFNIYPAKGRNMFRDLERICANEGIPFHSPQPFPQNSLLAARIALAASESDRPRLTRAIYRAEFGEGRSIGDAETLAPIIRSLGLDAAEIFERAKSDDVKQTLKSQTQEAQSIGIYGAPSFVTAQGELFWGNDRLEQAIEWACKEAR